MTSRRQFSGMWRRLICYRRFRGTSSLPRQCQYTRIRGVRSNEISSPWSSSWFRQIFYKKLQYHGWWCLPCLVSVEDRFQSQASLCEILVDKMVQGRGFLWITRGFPRPYSFACHRCHTVLAIKNFHWKTYTDITLNLICVSPCIIDIGE